METKVLPDIREKKGKKQQVKAMFDHIAPRYDFLNRFLSLKIDTLWRKKAFKLLKQTAPNAKFDKVLDVASGTGDFAFEFIQHFSPQSVLGLDISPQMLAIAAAKAKKKSLDHTYQVCVGDAENLNFEEHPFDLVSVAFGVRNFENLEKGIREIYRVLRPGGYLLILEFSTPRHRLIRALYHVYLQGWIPLLGRWISGNRLAYGYLGRSVKSFVYGKEFCQMLDQVGFQKAQFFPLSWGISTVYIACK